MNATFETGGDGSTATTPDWPAADKAYQQHHTGCDDGANVVRLRRVA